jgi:hypothetical protein
MIVLGEGSNGTASALAEKAAITNMSNSDAPTRNTLNKLIA